MLLLLIRLTFPMAEPTSNFRVNRRWLSACAMVLALLSAAPVGSQRAGSPAPEIGLEDTDGNVVRMADLQGKVVIVDFWASWCEPCREEIPFLNELKAEYGDRLVVVGVNLDRDEDNMTEFLERNPMNFRVVHDEDQDVAGRYRPSRMPSSYIIDRAGVVRFVHAGFEASDREEIRAHVRSLMR